MHVIITAVDQVFYDGEAYGLTVPGSEGEMTVLSHHMPLITTLRKGAIMLHESKDSQPRSFPIESGVLEVRRDGATVVL